jgi:hypothetical protein
MATGHSSILALFWPSNFKIAQAKSKHEKHLNSVASMATTGAFGGFAPAAAAPAGGGGGGGGFAALGGGGFGANKNEQPTALVIDAIDPLPDDIVEEENKMSDTVANRDILAKLVGSAPPDFVGEEWFKTRMHRLTGMYHASPEDHNQAILQLELGKLHTWGDSVGKPGKKYACDREHGAGSRDLKHYALRERMAERMADGSPPTRIQAEKKIIEERDKLAKAWNRRDKKDAFRNSDAFWVQVSVDVLAGVTAGSEISEHLRKFANTGSKCKAQFDQINPHRYREASWVKALSSELMLHEQHAWQLALLFESQLVAADPLAERDREAPWKINLFRAVCRRPPTRRTLPPAPHPRVNRPPPPSMSPPSSL